MKLFPKIIMSLIWLALFICTKNLIAQNAVVSLDKMNVVYVGLANPMTIAIPNCSCKDLVVRTSNGILTGSGCNYVLKPTQVGMTRIIVSNRKSKTGAITEYGFRTKMIPLPIFKIAQYGGYCGYDAKRIVNKKKLCAQEYVRAEMEFFDFDARFIIDSFHITISSDSSVTKRIINVSNKINDELHNGFKELHINDIIIFDKIFAKWPDEIERELDPLVLTVTE